MKFFAAFALLAVSAAAQPLDVDFHFEIDKLVSDEADPFE